MVFNEDNRLQMEKGLLKMILVKHCSPIHVPIRHDMVAHDSRRGSLGTLGIEPTLSSSGLRRIL